MLWKQGWMLVGELRFACAPTRAFLWMAICLAGMTTRKDPRGVTSIVRILGLVPACDDRLLDFFHSPALDLNKLTSLRKNSDPIQEAASPVYGEAGVTIRFQTADRS